MTRITTNPCSCSHSQEAQASHVVLTFERAALLYDIKNNCYIEGHLMADDGSHAKHTTQDVGAEGNIDRVTRILDLRHAEVVELLYPYTQYPVIHAGEGEASKPWSDRLEESDRYEIHLTLPADFSHTTVDLLEALIHEYLVCSVTGDWLSVTHPEKAATWLAKGQEALLAVKDNLSNRIGRQTTIKPYPF